VENVRTQEPDTAANVAVIVGADLSALSDARKRAYGARRGSTNSARCAGGHKARPYAIRASCLNLTLDRPQEQPKVFAELAKMLHHGRVPHL